MTLILEGTSIYRQQRSDHKPQPSSYLGQRNCNLMKFKSIELPDGFLLGTFGPFIEIRIMQKSVIG